MLERQSDERQQRPYPPRRKRPDLPSEPPSSQGNAAKWLAGIIGIVVVLVVLSRLNSPPEPEPTPVAVETQPAAPPPLPPVSVPGPQAVPPPTSASGTPTVDLLVRLEANRQVVRAGRLVYLDSMFAESDSVLRRWPDRPREPVLVAIVQDSLTQRAGAEGDAAVRDAFARWSALQLGGLRFNFISETSLANIVVQWITEFDSLETRTGQTDITVSPDGSIQAGRIQLALVDPAGKRLDQAAMLTVAVHEVGHVLGLGHSDRNTDVMFQSPRSPALSERDRRTIELVYGLPAGSVKGGN